MHIFLLLTTLALASDTDRYIITFKDIPSSSSTSDPHESYTTYIAGLSAIDIKVERELPYLKMAVVSLTEDETEKVKELEFVRYVEKDQMFTIDV